ncbi:uncharacterized protein LOC119796142 [Cyprinodon tularosa]|uniref:uncharacterized protein LOC119796142 n=1 Tax=Cyprinodon tularosa TaxID=77115 RepID=UPI0018E26A5B|nr:uncharacterized protein LOC119796142 [Cyprinodon tularosa]
MRFCKVLLCSAALALLAVSVESSSGGSTGTHSYDLSGQDLMDLYNKRVYQAEKVERRLGSSSSPFWPFSHTGVRVTLDDGSQWLVHKGDNYGITSQTVATDVRHMSSDWKPKGQPRDFQGTKTVADFVRVGGSNYHVLWDNCHQAADRMMNQ